MPFTLPQISRRKFLKRAALAGGIAACAPSTYAGLFGKSRDKHSFVFLSDTHIAADPAVISRDVNMAANLTACVHEVVEWPVKPAALIINGDLALKEGLPGDYATFGNLINPLRMLAPVHLLLGNHDERDNFWHAFPHDAARLKSVPQKQLTVFTSPRANWFLLDSLDKTNSTSGELGADQFLWLSQELVARPDKPAIIVVHHNLNNMAGISGLEDSAAMEELFVKFPQVKVFIFGHTHDWSISQHKTGVHLINLPPTSYVFKEGRPTGWVRCALAEDGVEIELRTLDKTYSDHTGPKRLRWRT